VTGGQGSASEKPNWTVVALLGALTAAGPLSVDMYLPALPAIGRSLGVGAAATQSSVSAFLAGMAIGQFFFGAASDRFGRKPPLMVGLAIFIAASMACAAATSYETLVAARFVQAFGACAGGVIARAAVRDSFGHTETARVLSAMMLVGGLAPVFAPLLGGFFLAAAGWRSIFWFLAASGVAMAILAITWLAETRSAETEAQARSENPLVAYAALLGRRRLIGYALAGALNGATLFTYISASPELLIGYYRIPAAHFGWVFSINAVGLIAAGQLNRWLLRGRKPDDVLRLSCLAAFAVAILIGVVAFSGFHGRWAMLALLFLLLSSYGLLQGNTLAGALSVDPLRGGAASALIGGVSFAMGAVASFITALMHDGTPRPMAVTMLVATAGSAAALYGLAFERRQPAAD
jgi:DHA1 family bicyclomycin/chloramphenicol resistance-like MFS transporter